MNKKKVDWVAVLVPLMSVLVVSALFVLRPDASKAVMERLRYFLGDKLGVYYILVGLTTFGVSMYVAFSKYGQIKLGKENDEPTYKDFTWGAMIFTSTMAADIVFFSLIEWTFYADEPYIRGLTDKWLWVGTYPLFHWGVIPWSFYIILAVSLAFMIHIKGVQKQKLSQACRPILGHMVDGFVGKMIDIMAIFALIAGTATTFSLATPLIAQALSEIMGREVSALAIIGVLVVIAIIYNVVLLMGMEAIAKLANVCIYSFIFLLMYILIFGGQTRFIIEMGVSTLGHLTTHFISMSTWTDPQRLTEFPQNWTIFYWAYWMVWCVATPFFIAMISKGRTIKKTILGGYFWGVAGTFVSFIILGNHGLGSELSGQLEVMGLIHSGMTMYEVIIAIIRTIPLSHVVLILMAITMVLFYTTTFDALTMVVSMYSYKEIEDEGETSKKMRAFWGIGFIVLPICFIFLESAMETLQDLTIIVAFPISVIMLIIVGGFMKELRNSR